ncbi:hypothetical protein PF005_g10795 [Phytophthora fragariae]|uniref:Uncharacterized protein n=1 Tax=Phytophthora fragariae TaxID=53985 RepID=A0A6A3F1H6_9STRA|nr:hypothetical protein PF003_g11403 [Phytophthora fragariae]KAE8938161.1 hypothetical protein PF009_g11951 [Phytophthora fragariae]KAE9011186.1 hypothetical protein PF011_g9492 [Phytophthora fragariae]KAE9113335.1 hypothetical protein PF010_g10124 [Phytophthora fragariae]KAE9119091.1 hypothetical protein PF007_g8691 [Phytophthora fragariae]
MSGHLDVVSTLVSHGVSINLADTYGNTPLMAAAESNHARVVAFLLEAGACVNAKTVNGDMALGFTVPGEIANAPDCS